MRVLSPRIHGVLDLVAVAFLLTAPLWLGLDRGPTAVSWILGGIHLGVVLLTDFEVGRVPAVPFALHGAIELVESGVVLALPWLLGFQADGPARVAFVVAGLAMFTTWLATDFARPALEPSRDAVDRTWAGPGVAGR